MHVVAGALDHDAAELVCAVDSCGFEVRLHNVAGPCSRKDGDGHVPPTWKSTQQALGGGGREYLHSALWRVQYEFLPRWVRTQGSENTFRWQVWQFETTQRGGQCDGLATDCSAMQNEDLDVGNRGAMLNIW